MMSNSGGSSWNSQPRIVEYVLLAEFDIDKGSTLREAYPQRVPGYDDSHFAEIMLPEGAHNRDVQLLLGTNFELP